MSFKIFTNKKFARSVFYGFIQSFLLFYILEIFRFTHNYLLVSLIVLINMVEFYFTSRFLKYYNIFKHRKFLVEHVVYTIFAFLGISFFILSIEIYFINLLFIILNSLIYSSYLYFLINQREKSLHFGDMTFHPMHSIEVIYKFWSLYMIFLGLSSFVNKNYSSLDFYFFIAYCITFIYFLIRLYRENRLDYINIFLSAVTVIFLIFVFINLFTKNLILNTIIEFVLFVFSYILFFAFIHKKLNIDLFLQLYTLLLLISLLIFTI